MIFPLTFAKYIAKQFISNFAIVIAVFSVIIIVFDIAEITKRVSGKSIPLHKIIELQLLHFPYLIIETLPFVVLISGILTFAKMTISSELIVVRTSGISAWQFMIPIIFVALLIGIITTTLFNPFSAVCFARYEALKTKYVYNDKNMLAISDSGLWLKQKNLDNGHNIIINASRIDRHENKIFNIVIYMFDEANNLTKTIFAREAHLAQNFWKINNAKIVTNSLKKEIIPEYILPTKLSFEQIQENFADPDTLGFWELPAFIKTLKKSGFSVLRHQSHYQNLLALPFLLIAMIMIAATFSLQVTRRGRQGIIISLGIVVGFLIHFLLGLISAIGLSGNIPIFMAVWLPIIIVIMFGITLLIHQEDG